MTEESPLKDDDYLVRVKAQVMCRDDSSGGWVPNGGGGMSIVGIRKVNVPAPEDVRHEYLIHGQRMADQSVVLNCVLKKDVSYHQATPTFHHWKMEEKRFGLTFQSSVDAGAFHKGIKRAVEDLLEDSPDASNLRLDVGDDDVFMTLDLPLGRKDSCSQSASTASTTTSSPTPQSPAVSMQDPFNNNTNTALSYNNSNQHLHRVHYIARPQRHTQQISPQSSDKSSKSSNESNGRAEELAWELRDKDRKTIQGSQSDSEIVDSSYVQFKKTPSVHDYSYPTLDTISMISKSSLRRDSVSSVKKQAIALQPALPMKMSKNRSLSRKDRKQSKHLLSQRSRCVYCNEIFVHDDNHRGSCEDAPDKVAECIEKATCICCAKMIIYHCMADTDGGYGHPCTCDSSDDSNTTKWIAMTILSLFLPCLWCYLPLTACHKCGVACNCCGGRHKTQFSAHNGGS